MKRAIKITTKVLLSTALLLSIIISTSSQAKADWKQDSNGWWYELKSGQYYKDRLEVIDGNFYRFDKRGYMITGWYYEEKGNDWYYFDPISGAAKNGWQKIDGKWYLFALTMLTGYNYVNNKHYYLDPVNGDMKTGWIKIEGKWRYFDPESGAQTEQTWRYINGKWYYFNAVNAVTGLQYINGKKYYFDLVNCDMKTGWTKVDGTQYYMDPNDGGAAAMNKTLLMNSVYYTFDWSGKLIKVELANK